MSNNEQSTRGYDEKEIGALIQRATELYEQASGESGESARKLSLKEIEHIASELGLPAEHLKAAAVELENKRKPGRSVNIWGAPFSVTESRVVDGELSEEQWEDIVIDLRLQSGRTGKTSSMGRTRQWTHTLGEGDEGVNFTKTQATVRPRNGQTSIQVQKSFGIVGALYYPAFILSVISAFAVTNAFPTPMAGFLSIAGIFGSMAAVRLLIARWTRMHTERMSGLADSLADTFMVSDPAAHDTADAQEELDHSESIEESVEPRIDLQDSEKLLDADTDTDAIEDSASTSSAGPVRSRS